MDVKKKISKKNLVGLILIALLLISASGMTLMKLWNTNQVASSEDKIRAYLAGDDSMENGVTAEEADAWIRVFLESDGEGSVEINRTLKIQKGYTVNGDKQIQGTGTFLAENSPGGDIFSISENSHLDVEGISADCNYEMNVAANIKETGSLTWKGGLIARAMSFGFYAGGYTQIEDCSVQDCDVWIEARKGVKVDVKDTEFYKCGSVGINVAEGAECTITGEKTWIEQTPREAIKNNGTFSMTDGNFFLTTGNGINNYGTVNLTGVKQNRSLQGGLVSNEIGATANVKDCTMWNNRNHVINHGEMNLEGCKMNMSSNASIQNEKEGTVTVKNVFIENSNSHGLYNNNGVANVENLECELVLGTGVVNIGKGITKVDGYSIDRCGMAINNGATKSEDGTGSMHVVNMTSKNALERNVFSTGGEFYLADSTMYPSVGYSVYIRAGSAVLDSIKILGTKKETSGGLAIGSYDFKNVDVTVKGNTVITGCASRGIINYSRLKIENCDVYGNNTAGKVDSGAGLMTVGTVHMYGGKIHDNHNATYGSGVRTSYSEEHKMAGKMYMHGGAIYDNTAKTSAGGVSIGKGSVFELRGGSVYDNVADTRGDGIVVMGTLNIYDAKRLGENDIYLTKGNKINVKSEHLSFDYAKLTFESYAIAEKVVTFPSAAAAEKLCNKFVAKNHQFTVQQNKKTGVLAHSKQDFDTDYDFSNAAVVTVTNFKQLKDAIESTKSNASKVIIIGADIAMTDKITVPVRTDIKLIDDGTARKLVRATDNNLLVVGRDSHLVVAGTAGLAIDGDALNGKVVEKSLVCARNFGYFVLENGGSLQNAYNKGLAAMDGVRGAAVNTGVDGYFLMKGGSIMNCASPDDDNYNNTYCAIYGSSTSGVSIKGGSISNGNDRAVLSYNYVYMSGGSIENCKQIGAGGAAIRTPGFVMTGGTIQNCLSTNSGSAVYIATGSHPEGYFKLDGGVITNNKNGTVLSKVANGGAIYIDEAALFKFVSGEVSNNVAGDDEYRMACAAILNDGEAYIEKDAKITGNTSTLSTGAIYNRATGEMTITGADISNNASTNVCWKETEYGSAGAINNEGTLVLDGANVINNQVGTYGTVYSTAGNLTLKNMTFTGNRSGASEETVDVYGNKIGIKDKGIDLTVRKQTKPVTLSGMIVAEEHEAAFRLEQDNTFKLAKDFDKNSKINLYLHGDIYVGRKVLSGNVTSATVSCFTWTNPKEGYYLAKDGSIQANKTEAVIGDVKYVTLEEAVAAAEDGDVIELLQDVSIDNKMKVNKSITITTDGKANRTISLEASSSLLTVNDAEVTLTLKGASKDSKLIFDGTGVTLEGRVVDVDAANKIVMQDVVMQNITGTNEWGNVIRSKAVVEAENCTFANCHSTQENQKGGAIYLSSSAANSKFINCSFDNCSSSYQGGAIYTTVAITVEGCEFNQCSAAKRAGAIYMVKDSTVENSTFTGCSAGERGGAIYAESSMSVTGCTFGGETTESANTAGDAGGAIMVQAENTLTIANSTFKGNMAGTTEKAGSFGGAIGMSSAKSTIILEGDVVFDGNKAMTSKLGGGAIMVGSTFTIADNANVTITNNQTTTKGIGGGIYFNVTDTPAFTIGENATLTMSGNTDKDGNSSDIATVAGMADEGEQFIQSKQAISQSYQVLVGDVSYKTDANGYLVGLNPTVELRQGDLIRQFSTLKKAMELAADDDTIALLDDITLDSQVKIDKSVTITTDGVADRTISCGTNSSLLYVNDANVTLTLQGVSEDSKLIFDGNGEELTGRVVDVNAAKKVVMQYVTMQNITGTDQYGTAIRSKANVQVVDCEFDNIHNTYTTKEAQLGGAVFLSTDQEQDSTFTNCNFNNCSSSYRGGAIYASVPITVTNSKFTGCKAIDTKGRGGAICGTAKMTIEKCTFGDGTDAGQNQATNGGGAIASQGVSLTLTIKDSTFDNNLSTAQFGGAVCFSNSGSILNLEGTCIFRNNKAKGSNDYKGGGAIFAPENVNVKNGAWIELYGNECTGYNSGDAICVNTKETSLSTFVIEKGASVYVYDNPQTGDTHNDVCNNSGTAFTVTNKGIYETWKPVVKIGNVGYSSLQDALENVSAGGELQLVNNVTLTTPLTVDKSVTITTDGVEDRTISCGVTSSLLTVNNADVTLTLKGASEDSKLIFDGNNQTITGRIVDVVSAKKIVLQDVVMRNISGTNNQGSALGSNATIEAKDCTFVNCHNTHNAGNVVTGGAIYLSKTATNSQFEECEFENCSSTRYGGAILTESTLTVKSCIFIKCYAKHRGGAIAGNKTTMTIEGCTFGDGTDAGKNWTDNAGGAIQAQDVCTVTIKDSTFDYNLANGNFGGAVGFSSADSTLNLEGRCIFRNNVGTGDTTHRGGALYAPATFNIAAGAWIEFYGNRNQSTTNPHGDAFGINAASADKVKLTIGGGASLYVYDNPSADDGNYDICIQKGVQYIPNKGEGTYSTSAPQTTE